MQHSNDVKPSFGAPADKMSDRAPEHSERETLILRLRNTHSSRDNAQADWQGDVQHIKDGEPVDLSSFRQTDGLIRHVVNKIKSIVGEQIPPSSNTTPKPTFKTGE